MKPINVLLRSLRQEHEKKQSEIARLLGTTQQQYSKYETGESDIPARVIALLAHHYGVSSDFVMGLTECREGIDALNCTIVDDRTTGHLLTDILSLETAGRRAVLEYIDLQRLKQRVYGMRKM